MLESQRAVFRRGRILDEIMELYAITLIATLACDRQLPSTARRRDRRQALSPRRGYPVGLTRRDPRVIGC
jgi:hypothetical protein